MPPQFVLAITSDPIPGRVTYTVEKREAILITEILQGPYITGIVQIAMALRATEALPETVVDGIERLNGWYRLEMHMTEDAAKRFVSRIQMITVG